MASFGLIVMIILLLWTLAERRTLKGPLQVILICCAIALPLIPVGDEFTLVHWAPHVVTGLGVISFMIARVNSQME